MAKGDKRSARSGRVRHGPRRREPLVQRLVEHRLLESGVGDFYDLVTVATDHLSRHYVWQVSATVPVYDATYSLRIELDERAPVQVVAENWTGPMKHTYGKNRLCMWLPGDPPEKRWDRSDGLLKLIDTAVLHLFMELYWRENGEWLGEEAPHDIRKIESHLSEIAAA